MQNSVKYPIGIQDFPKIRKEGLLYIDKTKYIYDLTHSGAEAVFLSRPRRFGKSLLVSTLKAYFEGRKELFKGLAIEELETEWNEYPVLCFSFAASKFEDHEDLRKELDFQLSTYENIYGTNEKGDAPSQRLKGLITRAHKQTGKEVVVLIDEYDAPMLNVMHEPEKLENVRKVMNNFYSPLKDCGGMMRFLFLTGITKFSQVSIFSELNNLLNISMEEDFAGICGITEEEMLANMDAGIEKFAEKGKITKEEAIKKLKDNYDGYHFCWPSPDVYNPFSLLNAMRASSIKSYWYASTPSFLVNLLKKNNILPSDLGGDWTSVSVAFDAPVNSIQSGTPLLYQSGYITIKGYDEESEIYTLHMPNKEIRIGLIQGLLPNYLGSNWEPASVAVRNMIVALLKDDIDGMLTFLQTFLGTVPYVEHVNRPEVYEGHWQQVLYCILALLGASVDVEVRTPKGRVDLVARTAQKLYLFELKIKESADAAMEQINLNNYPARFALSGLPITKVGIKFDKEERNITKWVVE